MHPLAASSAPATPTAPRILTGRDGKRPAGPGFARPLLSARPFSKGPLDVLEDNARTFGDLTLSRAVGRNIFQCNHPELAQEMLVTDARHHHRGMVMQRSKLVLGEGLLTSEDPLHMRQRRLAQPAFHRDRIAAYGRIIGQYAAEMTRDWQPGTTREVHSELQTLALRIVGKTLFDQELAGATEQIARAIDNYMAFLPLVFLPFSDLIQKLPLPMMRRIHQSRREVDAIIFGIIGERRADGRDRGDLLSMLLASEDTEDQTGSMTDMQVRDECVTAMLAGNETTANALSFALALLARHPEAQRRAHEEAAHVLGDGCATAEHFPALRFIYQCFAEAMRLYPPVWVTARTAAAEYTFRGFTVPKGSLLLAPQWIMHRDPRFWDQPTCFAPERFAEEGRGKRPRMSYFPFGAGSRQCIGEGLAWMEGVLSLATVVRDWKLAEPAGARPLRIKARVTIRPDGPLPLTVTRW
jgi:cytochrome P450